MRVTPKPPVDASDHALSDEELVARVRGGQTALFELLLRRHNQRLFRVTRAILRHDAEAEDTVQAAWISVYTHLGQYAGAGRFATWITRIAVHEALGRARHRFQLDEVDLEEGAVMDSLEANGRSPEAEAQGRELGALIEAAIDELPDIYRLVFVMREVQQLAVAETAAALDISEDNVKVRLHRAKAMLRSAMAARLERAAPQAFPFLGERCDRIVAAVLARIAPGRL